MIDHHPKKCNICGGPVIYTSNSVIYGREYGSGKCYLCKNCGAYVGTHKPRPKEALGLLADAEMRDLKMRCHALFDLQWKSFKGNRKVKRQQAYKALAEELNIPVQDCHFGYFDKDMLLRAFSVLSNRQYSLLG